MTTLAVSVGCDPEMFLRQKDKFVSAHGLIPGTKTVPHKVRGGAVQVDGMAVEFNIDPASNAEDFKSKIREVMEQLRGMLPDYQVVANPVAHFDEDYMKSQPEEALELGCDPDYNAYTSEANERPDGDVPFRTAGGHVHVGWTTDVPVDDPDHIEACQMLTKELDFYLGLASLFWDEDDKRREMYGAPGAYRPKSYGVEYRSLSNAWVREDHLQEFVFNQVSRAFSRLSDGKSYYNIYMGLARVAIENNDRDLAYEIFKQEPDILGDNLSLVEGYMEEYQDDVR